MTPEGTELAEFIPLGPSVKALAKRIDGITSTQIGGRIMTLSRESLCVPIRLLPASQGRGWQRTPKGDQLLERVDQVGVMGALAEYNATINADRDPNDTRPDRAILRPEDKREPEIDPIPEELWDEATINEGRDS